MSWARAASKVVFTVSDYLLRSPRGPRILIYHQVGLSVGQQMEVAVEDFDWQLNWLAENRQVVDLETAIELWDEPDSDQFVVLTFDDGYSDLYTEGLPRLKAYGYPFTLYLATQGVESRSESSLPERLTWDQIEDMYETGLLTIGGHTHTHRDLRHAEPDEITEELVTSDSLIESRLGVRVRHFAYPWGYWSESADRLIRERYETAMLGAPSITSSIHVDNWLIHRFPIQMSDGSRWFPSRLRGGFLSEEVIRRILRQYDGP